MWNWKLNYKPHFHTFCWLPRLALPLESTLERDLPLESTSEREGDGKRMKGLAPFYLLSESVFLFIFLTHHRNIFFFFFYIEVADDFNSRRWFQFADFPGLTEPIPVFFFGNTSTSWREHHFQRSEHQLHRPFLWAQRQRTRTSQSVSLYHSSI